MESETFVRQNPIEMVEAEINIAKLLTAAG
jgi:hypothetical protein